MLFSSCFTSSKFPLASEMIANETYSNLLAPSLVNAVSGPVHAFPIFRVFIGFLHKMWMSVVVGRNLIPFSS